MPLEWSGQRWFFHLEPHCLPGHPSLPSHPLPLDSVAESVFAKPMVRANLGIRKPGPAGNREAHRPKDATTKRHEFCLSPPTLIQLNRLRLDLLTVWFHITFGSEPRTMSGSRSPLLRGSNQHNHCLPVPSSCISHSPEHDSAARTGLLNQMVPNELFSQCKCKWCIWMDFENLHNSRGPQDTIQTTQVEGTLFSNSFIPLTS